MGKYLLKCFVIVLGLSASLHGTGTIAGVVTSQLTGLPIAGATVSLFRQNNTQVLQSVTTAANGSYTFAQDNPGNYSVRASATGFQTKIIGSKINNNQTTTVNFALVTNPGIIAGQVVNNVNSQPIVGATVEVYQDGFLYASATTNALGNYSISGFSDGSYTVTASASGFSSIALGARVVAGLTTTLNFSLPINPGTISGTITSQSSGLPIANAAVKLFQNNTLIASALTNVSGAYSLTGIPQGAYTIQAEATNFRTASQGVSVTAGVTTTANLALTSSPGIITGTITDASSATPIAGATVKISLNNITIATIATDSAGIFTATELAPGSYSVQAQATNYQTTAQGAVVVASGTTTANIGLTPSPGTISGQITSVSSGNPLAGASVTLSKNGSIVSTTLTDTQGSYAIASLAPGSYTLQVTAANFQTTSRGVIVLANQNVVSSFSLSPSPGSAQGQVTNAVSGTPIVGATIELKANGVTVLSAITDATGNYAINGIAPGAYVVAGMATNFQNAIAGIIIVSNQTATANLALSPSPGKIVGAVTSLSSGNPIAGASVTLLSNGSVISVTLTDDVGAFMISNIAPGSYTLQVSALNFETLVHGVIVLANQTSTSNFSLADSPGSVSGAITNAVSGDPIPSAEVAVEWQGTVVATTLSDHDGNYQLVGLAPGTYVIHVRAADYQSLSQGIKITAALNTDLNIALIANPGQISGTVTETTSGNPISGALVEVQRNGLVVAFGVTSSSGAYAISGIAPGVYSVSIKEKDHQSFLTGAIVLASLTTTVNAELTLSPGTISGVVTNDVSGDPIPNAVVTVDVGGTLVGSAVTNDVGAYLITGISPGSYTIKAQAALFETLVQGAIVLPNATTISNFSLQVSPGSISGTVESEDTGTPISGASVDLKANGSVVATTLTAADGTYSFEGVAPGAYSVLVSAKTFSARIIGANIVALQNTVVDIVLSSSPGSISGTVVTQGNAPIAGAKIEVERGGVLIASVLSDADGNYLITGLAPGSYTIQVTVDGFQHNVQGVIVLPDQESTTDFSLEPNPGDIAGTVTELLSGLPIAGATVEVQTGNNASTESIGIKSTLVFTTRTDALGNYLIENIAPGSYVISVHAKDYQNEIKGVIVIADETSTVNFELQKDPGSISGTVTNALTSDPLPSAVLALDLSGAVISQAFTDAFGNYTLTDIAPGSYIIRVAVDGFETKVLGVIVEPNLETPVDFALSPNPGAITGVVTNLTSDPIDGALVIVSQGSTTVVSALTDSDGKFVLTGLAPGVYVIQVKAKDFQNVVQGVSVVSNQTTSVDFQLVANPGSIKGRVVTTEGESIPGAVVALDLSGTAVASAFVDDLGNYLIVGIAPGSYTIQAHADLFQTETIGVTILAGEESVVDFVLEANPGSISGTVTDENTGDPIVGALVEARVATLALSDEGPVSMFAVFHTLTDSNGFYVLSGLSPGSYVVQAQMDNYQSEIKGAIVAPDEDTIVDFSLQPNPGSIVGTIIDTDSGDPLASVIVEVKQGNTTVAQGFTDADGKFRIDGLAPGRYTVQVRADNFQGQFFAVTVSANQTDTVNFSLVSDPGALIGTVKNTNDEPLIGSTVTLELHGVSVQSALTDNDGNFSITGLSPGSYTVRASKSGFAHKIAGAEIKANLTTTVDLVLAANPGSIFGRVTSLSSGDGIVSAVVEVKVGETLVSSILTDEEGNFLIEGIAPGAYVLRVSADNYQGAIQGVVVVSDQRAEENFALVSSPGGVAGVIKSSASGDPIVGARVLISQNGVAIGESLTDAQGLFAISGLAPGAYSIQAEATDFQHFVQGVIVVANQISTVDFSLASSPGSITGLVTNAVSNAPIASATVTIESNGDVIATAVTDNQGSYVITGLAPGNYNIYVKAEDFQTAIQGVVVIANVAVTVNMSLQPNPGSIQGTVTSFANGDAIPGAIVALDISGTVIATSLADTTGNYLISGLAPGSYTIQARSSLYQTKTVGVIVVASQSSTVNFVLESAPGNISGTVTDFVSGDPIVGATVEVQIATAAVVEEKNSLAIKTVFTALTDSAGHYLLTGLAPGSYTITVRALDYQTEILGVIVNALETSVVDFALLSDPGAISGDITSSDASAPVKSALVQVEFNGSVVASALTDGAGHYDLYGIAPGSYTLKIHAEDFQNVFLGVNVLANQTTDVDIELMADPGGITGTVKALEDNLPVAGAIVELELSGTIVSSAISDPSGKFMFSGIAPGAYTIHAQATDFQSQIEGVIIEANQTAEVNFLLAADPGSIAGVITDSATNQPIGGSIVALDLSGAVIFTAFSDPAGNYLITGIAPGSYTMRVQAQNYQTVIRGVLVLANQTATANFSLSPNPGSITGVVTNAQTTDPIIGAVVILDDSGVIVATGLSDGDGRYVVSGIAPGNYFIHAEASGYQSLVQGVTVFSNQTTTLNFELVPDPGEITGRITDSSTSNPIAGASIDVLINGVTIASALSDADGNYMITGLAPGSYIVHAHATDYQNAVVGAIVLADQTTTVDIALVDSPGSISGRVVTQIGFNPIPGAVLALDLSGAVVSTVLTDSDGNYVISDIAPGVYIIQAKADGFTTITRGVLVTANQNTVANFALVANPGKVIGTVRDAESSAPIVGAAVKIESNGSIIASGFTDSDGNYELSGLAPDFYTIHASAADYASAVLGVSVLSNQSTIIDFSLNKDYGSITGTITDINSDDPIAGAIIELLVNNALIATKISNSDGEYLFENVAPGSATIRVHADGYGTVLQGVVVNAHVQTRSDVSLTANPGALTGNVRNGGNNLAISGATVELQANGLVIASTFTDVQGNFALDSLPPGAYQLQISKDGFAGETVGVIITADQTTDVDIELSADAGEVFGVVKSEDSLDPIMGATVTLTSNGSTVAFAFTDANGRYSLTGIAPGNYTIKATASDFAADVQSVVVVANVEKEINFALSSALGKLEGVVLDKETGEPIVGAVVEVVIATSVAINDTGARGVGLFFALTDSEGESVIDGIPPGTYDVVVRKENYLSAIRSVIIEEDQTTTITILVEEGEGTIEGSVTNATDAPIAQALVEVSQNNTVVNSTLTDAHGDYVITGLAPGTYVVHVSQVNYQSALQQVDVLVNRTSVADFVLAANPGAIEGRVTDADNNQPLIGALIEIIDGNIVIASTLTDSLGHYSIKGLPFGDFTVHVTADNYQNKTSVASVISNQTTTVNFALLSNPGAIVGTLRNSSNDAPINAALIEVFLDDVLLFTSRSDGDGHFSILGLAPGEYTIRLSADGYDTQTIVITIVAGEETSISVSLNLSDVDDGEHEHEGGGLLLIPALPPVVVPELDLIPETMPVLESDEEVEIVDEEETVVVADAPEVSPEPAKSNKGGCSTTTTSPIGLLMVMLAVLLRRRFG